MDSTFSYSAASQYNLTNDFIFMEQDWGSIFYMDIGQLDKITAKETCLEKSSLLHLPIPRSEAENAFYQSYFSDKNLWLDIETNEEKTIFKSSDGHIYTKIIDTFEGPVQIDSYEWIDFALIDNNDFYGVQMVKNGTWELANESLALNSICVYNVIEAANCTNCFNVHEGCQNT